MEQYIFWGLISVLFVFLISVIIKLIMNSIAVKTVSVIYRNTDYSIFGEIFGRAFLYGYLADLIGCFIGTIALTLDDIIKNGFAYWQLYLLTSPSVLTATPYDLPSLIIIILSVLISIFLTFVFCCSKVLTKTDLSKKQRLISALIIALITAPYYFLFSIGIPL
ncbi:hypothetical protein [Ruminococcus sp.]|jgi:hypothetical protein|uniref:hypothetical protein n=1 Tax=Ruminococcus sp. TaxID=41978 RepID=UPI00262E99CC|nr:hypothetical protein [Ruminococcus sp.]MCI2111890.1 hypothetical protein [Ruminococcus sp.]MDD6988866.1 hypothetical protein [Ruminococcus sp.]MDY6201308.1 hypothetical protein [Ruminococcus sp.]